MATKARRGREESELLWRASSAVYWAGGSTAYVIYLAVLQADTTYAVFWKRQNGFSARTRRTSTLQSTR